MNDRLVMINDEVPSVTEDRLPFDHPHYRQSYRIFHELSREAGFPLRYCSPADFDLATGQLRGYWEPTPDGWRTEEEPFFPEFIFDKASGSDPHCTGVIEYYEAQGVKIFDPPDLGRLCASKWRHYMHFARYSPLSDLLPQHPDLIVDAIHEFFERMDRTYAQHDNKVVVKPLHGYQSRGIHMIARKPHGLEMHMLFGGQIHGAHIDHNLQAMARTPYLIQAWVDTSDGIPEIDFDGTEHDVRFIFRIAERGKAQFVLSYLKTVQGMLYYPVESYGPEPWKVVEPIADWIADHFDYGIFSVDVMRDRSGQWFLTELNDQVGITMRFENEWDVNSMTYFMKSIIEEMKRAYEGA